jgi:transcription antitermination protein NusB
MISRRLLRVKALQTLYAFNRKESDDLMDAERELTVSIEKAYDLYLYLLLLFIELADISAEKIEAGLQKKIPAWEDLNPNRRFVQNRLIKILSESEQLSRVARDRPISWAGHSEIPRVLYTQMVNWEGFTGYRNSEDDSFLIDRKFLNHLLKDMLLESDDLLSHLEERSIYWNDDLEFAVIMIEKTLRKLKSGQENESFLVSLFKNEEDQKFAFQLLRNSLLRGSEIRSLIDSNTTNWEIERIALMDILVMQLAIAEIMAFPEIPVKVTLNEYIEIAKYYCTSKSSTFINGILDKVVREMKAGGLFVKAGRGLIGEKNDNEHDG